MTRSRTRNHSQFTSSCILQSAWNDHCSSPTMITATLHSILDYFVGILLIAFPYLFRFHTVSAGRTFFWIVGGLIIIYSLFTHNKFSLDKKLPLIVHKTFDFIIGFFVATAPVLFNYSQSISPGLRVLHIITRLQHYLSIHLDPSLSLRRQRSISKGQPLPAQRFVPQAQQNIDPSKATLTLEIQTDPNNPGFMPERLSAKPGEIVKLIFSNRSIHEHYDNFVVVQPGKENEVGNAGLKAGPEAGYIPHLPNDIIAYSQTIVPGATTTFYLRVPSQPGFYPYISTFPHRWEAMRGVLEIKE